MSHIRPAAVAGMFYPGEAGELDAVVRRLLDGAAKGRTGARRPKAIIAPHAGYIYSGPVAASAYACLHPFAENIHRIVLIGPCHRVPLRGLAVSKADAFATPLGPVPVDTAAVADLLTLPQVSVFEATHAEEHCLEVHLPFLQEILRSFSIIPLVAGEASAAQVAEVLERLWGGDETLIVISSDLSHYLDYETARRLDAATTRAIEALAASEIGFDQACGRVPVAGLLEVARRRRLKVKTLDVRSSGDTAGDRRRVVGYGAWLFTEPDAPKDPAARDDESEVTGAGSGGYSGGQAEAQMLDAVIAKYGATMLALARASIRHGLDHGRPPELAADGFTGALAHDGASFVTLRRKTQLRGCIGTARAFRPLVEDIAENAFAAAFEDRRFPRLERGELQDLAITVSLLGAPAALSFRDEDDLLDQLRPGRDGLIIEAGDRRALFLPQVWATVPAPRDFLVQLKRKAGLAADACPEDLRAWRFCAASVPEVGAGAG
jgi:AmmeMemoRadiSam system protein B/AmmeMemoRadiSam system protein A